MTTTDWPEDGLEFAIWALTDEGRNRICSSVTRHMPLGINHFLGMLDDEIVAVEKVVATVKDEETDWTGRLTLLNVLKLYAHVKAAQDLIKEYRKELCPYLQRDPATNTEKSVRTEDFRARLKLEIDALKEVLASSKLQA